jgi:REP element-mobilizing transposase RayT
MKLELDTNSHAVYSLNYHLILITKDRREVFTNKRMFDTTLKVIEKTKKKEENEKSKRGKR